MIKCYHRKMVEPFLKKKLDIVLTTGYSYHSSKLTNKQGNEMSARELYGNKVGYVQECKQRTLPTMYRTWVDMEGGCDYKMRQFTTKEEALKYLDDCIANRDLK